MSKSTPMLDNLSNAKLHPSFKNKIIDFPIVFDYQNEEEFFAVITSWARLYNYVLCERKDHYMGFAFRILGTGKGVLALWNNGKASIYVIICNNYYDMINGKNKTYMSYLREVIKKYDIRRADIIDLFRLFQVAP